MLPSLSFRELLNILMSKGFRVFIYGMKKSKFRQILTYVVDVTQVITIGNSTSSVIQAAQYI